MSVFLSSFLPLFFLSSFLPSINYLLSIMCPLRTAVLREKLKTQKIQNQKRFLTRQI